MMNQPLYELGMPSVHSVEIADTHGALQQGIREVRELANKFHDGC